MKKTYYLYKGKQYSSRAALEKYLMVYENTEYNASRTISANAEMATVDTPVKVTPKRKPTKKRGK